MRMLTFSFMTYVSSIQVAAHINDIARIFGHVLGTKEIEPGMTAMFIGYFSLPNVSLW